MCIHNSGRDCYKIEFIKANTTLLKRLAKLGIYFIVILKDDELRAHKAGKFIPMIN